MNCGFSAITMPITLRIVRAGIVTVEAHVTRIFFSGIRTTETAVTQLRKISFPICFGTRTLETQVTTTWCDMNFTIDTVDVAVT